MKRVKRINWWIVAAFGLIVIFITAAVIRGLSQPVDAQQLQTANKNLQAAAAEGVFIASLADRQTETYFQAQLEDLENLVDDNRQQMEKAKFDPSIADQRQQYLDTSRQVSDVLHALSLSYHDPEQLAALQAELQKLMDSLEKLS